MKSIDLKLGYSCNNNCVFCVRGDKRKKFEDKTTAEAKQFIKEVKDDCDEIVFTGGEPTIRNDLPELVSYASQFNFKKIQIQSNGRRFAYKDYCKELIKRGANEFGLSLHGSKPEIHNKLTKNQKSFSQTIKGIKNLISLDQKVAVNCVIAKPNYKDHPALTDLLIDLGVERCQFTFLYINNLIKDDPQLVNKIVPRISETILYIKKAIKKEENNNISIFIEAIPPCFLEEYKEHILDFTKEKPEKVYKKQKIKDYNRYKQNQFKTKGEECKECKYFNNCEGIWKVYPGIFGWEEFKPIN